MPKSVCHGGGHCQCDIVINGSLKADTTATLPPGTLGRKNVKILVPLVGMIVFPGTA